MTRYTSTLRRRPDPRRGQFIVIYIMGFFTMVMIAFVTLAIGQIMVRKQWAQLIADAGAFAGASKEAEGLNTMARINEFELNLLNATQIKDRVTGYRTSSWTECWAAYFGSKYSDIRKRHKNRVKPLFDAANLAMTGVNVGYRPYAYTAANEVTNDNIAAFFPNENSGDFKKPFAASYIMPLVDLSSDYFDETVAWWYWTTDPGPCYWGVCAGYVCTGLSLINCDISGVAGMYSLPGSSHDQQPEPPLSSYHFEKVLRVMEPDNETTFLWWVSVPAVPPVLGFREVLGDIPPIVAVSRAKPYGGTTGRGDGSNTKHDAFPNRLNIPFPTWAVGWEWDKEPKNTYKAKFVPVLPIRVREDTLTVADIVANYPTGWTDPKSNVKPRSMFEFLGIAH